MRKMSDDEVKEALSRQDPRQKLERRAADRDPPATRAKPDACTPEMAVLRRKYFGDDAESVAGEPQAGGRPQAAGQPETARGMESAHRPHAASAERAGAEEREAEEPAESEIVTAEIPPASRSMDERSRSKARVIDGRKKKVVGSQG